MAVENYHLKWDSHVTYLNSSVATLYKNEKFADVVLYSSSSSINNSNGNNPHQIDNAIPTVGISAHKFILSSCSQFFATLFDNTPIPTSNGVLYVVLPPELSHRAIQILVQYIYTGEATVSNDILNEVLRGGEILKIRGLCRTGSQRESGNGNSGITNSNSNNNSNSNSAGGTTCSNSIHYATNGTRSQHSMLGSTTVIHGTSQLTNELYPNQKCSAQSNPPSTIGLNGSSCNSRYGIDHLTHNSIHSQIRGLGASVMPKDSPVIVKSPKLSQIGGQLSGNRESKHHGSGITVNKEVAIDPDENCCYQAAVVPSILQHESLQIPLPPPPPPSQSLGSISSGNGLCNDVGCKNCSFNASCEPEKQQQQRQRQRHLSQSDELPHRLPSNERLEREYSDERCEPSDVQLCYSRSGRSRNGNERISNYFVTDHYDPASHAQAHLIATGKTPKKYDSVVATPTNPPPPTSPPLYPHNFLTIKQEPVDWTTPQSTNIENPDDMIGCGSLATSSPPPSMHGTTSPKQPLDFKITVTNAANVKIEAGTSTHSADEDEQPPQQEQQQQQQLSTAPYSDFSRLVCDVCKKSFDEPKLWVQHLETHTTTTGGSGAVVSTTTTTTLTTTQIAIATSNNAILNNENNGSDTLNKTYVPKKRRRVSQQENNMMDHVTLLCDLCNTSFDTPAEWVRHMNNQHTEIELAMFNSKKDKEQKSTNTSSISCSSGGSRSSHHQQHLQQQHQHHHHSHHHQKHQQSHKKYSNRGGMPSTTHSRNDSNTGSLSRNSLSPSPPPSQQ